MKRVLLYLPLLLLTTFLSFSKDSIANPENINSYGFDLSLGASKDGLDRGYVNYNFLIAERMNLQVGVSDILSTINNIQCQEIGLNFILDFALIPPERSPFYSTLYVGYSIVESTGSDLDAAGIEMYGHGFKTGSTLGYRIQQGSWTYGLGGKVQLFTRNYIASIYGSDGIKYSEEKSDREFTFGPDIDIRWNYNTFIFRFNTAILFNDVYEWAISPSFRVLL